MSERFVWLQWVLANALPSFFIAIFVRVAGQIADGPGMSLLSYMALAGTLAVMQWLVLRKKIAHPGRWLAATLTGMLLGVIASMPLMAITDVAGHESLAIIGGNALGGIILGTAQWFVLRREVRRAGWWVMVSSTAWVVMAGVGAALYKLGWTPFSEAVHFPGYRELAFLGWLLIGYGVLTGGVLAWLLRQRLATA